MSKRKNRRRRIFVKRKSTRGRKPKRHFSSNFERTTAKYLVDKGIPFDYENTTIDYVKMHSYLPDFEINDKFIIETKGRFLPSDRSKHLLIKKQHPDKDIRFLFMSNNKISKTSKKRYSDWCDHYGFKYAFKEIPQEWLDEAMR